MLTNRTEKHLRISIHILIMPRKVEVTDKEFRLTDKKVIAVLDRTITPFGNSAKADVPIRYVGKRAYVVILG
jgi:putative transposon-encoded protein